MKHYTVRVTDEAFGDLNSIFDYIDQELLNPDAAVRMYNRLLGGMRSLEELPERVKLMNSEPEHTQGLRMLPIDNYAIIFDIHGDVVNIINIFYVASDIIGKLRGE